MLSEESYPGQWESAYREVVPTVQYSVDCWYQQTDGTYAPGNRDYRVAEQGSTISVTDDDRVPEGTPSATGVWRLNEEKSVTSGVAGETDLAVYFDWCESAKLGYYHQNADGSWPDVPLIMIDSADLPDGLPSGYNSYYWPILETVGFAYFVSIMGVPGVSDDEFAMSQIDPTVEPASGEYVHDTSREVISLTVQPNTGSGNTNEFKACFKLNFTVTFHDPTGINPDIVVDSLNYGDVTPEPPDIESPGLVFAGWSPPISPTVTQDVTYTAAWKVDLDPIFSSKLITVGQLSRLTGSGSASGAHADRLVTMGQLARLTGKQAPAEDKKNKLVTVGQAYSVV